MEVFYEYAIVSQIDVAGLTMRSQQRWELVSILEKQNNGGQWLFTALFRKEKGRLPQ